MWVFLKVKLLGPGPACDSQLTASEPRVQPYKLPQVLTVFRKSQVLLRV